MPPLPSNGPLEIEAVLPWPNPNPQALFVRLKGPCDSVEVRLYSGGRALMRRFEGGPQNAGWARLDLPPETLAGLPAGACHYRVLARRTGASPAAETGNLLVLP